MIPTILTDDRVRRALPPQLRRGRHRAKTNHGPGAAILLYGRHCAARLQIHAEQQKPRLAALRVRYDALAVLVILPLIFASVAVATVVGR